MGTDGSYTCDEPSITCKLVESLSCTPETNIMCQLYSIPTEKDLLPPTAPPPPKSKITLNSLEQKCILACTLPAFQG